MIVKVAGGRRDGKSSFKKLGKYLTDGILQSGEAPGRYQWQDLTQYITQESVLDALGDNVEKTIAVELHKVLSLRSAAEEMQAVAAHNDRVKDPVYHYILSWPEKERPSTENIFKAARHTLKALGLEEHQYIIAIHANTDNLHAHIGANRVHPDSFKSAALNFAHATLHKAAREAEIEFGWSHDKGIFEVIEIDGAKHIVKASEASDPEVWKLTGRSKDFEVWRGEESLVSWCRKEPAAALKAVLEDPATSSWQDVHRVLADYGLELRDSGGSGMRVFDRSEGTPGKADKPVSISASSAFRFMKRSALESRFGPFVFKTVELPDSAPEKTYKRDPKKRLERRLQRKALRDDLHKRFTEHLELVKRERAIAQQVIKEMYEGSDKEEYDNFDNLYRINRQSINNDRSLSKEEKKNIHLINKLNMQLQRLELKEELKKSRAERRKLIPALPVWREWVEEQAQLGDEAAISALRGIIYQEGRHTAKAASNNAEYTENTIRPASFMDTDPYVRASQNLIWKVAKNGNVNYSFQNGEAGFTDEGHQLIFGRHVVSDEALMTSIRYAAEKWGELYVSGGDAIFKQRVVYMAVVHNVLIRNPELQALQIQLRAAKSQQAATPKDQAYEDINSLIKTRHANAVIRQPEFLNKTYAGPIVGENSKYFVQHIGRNDYMLHHKDMFNGAVPVSGRSISITYGEGRASVNARPRRGKGGR